jgi:hypothetical protein
MENYVIIILFLYLLFNFISIILLFIFSIIIYFIFPKVASLTIMLMIDFIFLFILILFLNLYLFFHNIFTYYIITDQRLIRISHYCFYIDINFLFYNEIQSCEINFRKDEDKQDDNHIKIKGLGIENIFYLTYDGKTYDIYDTIQNKIKNN